MEQGSYILTWLDEAMQWYTEQTPETAIAIVVFPFLFLALWLYFLPWIQYKWWEIWVMRSYWKMVLREGKRMSRKNDYVADEVSHVLREAQQKGKITFRDRKNYLKLLDDLFNLQGKLLPLHPNPLKLKADIRRRSEAKTVRQNTVVLANTPIPFPDKPEEPKTKVSSTPKARVVISSCRVISAS